MKSDQSKKLTLAVVTISLFHISKCVEILRPRGVSISKASLYNPDKDFTCLDGTLTIPFLYVNDDYCDCLDGSDEPGTPACPNGTFHCTNAGHQPLDIPSSRINDGICDCCDGTDEFDGREKRSGGFCTNTCMALGRAAREDALRLAELQRQGAELRREMARQGREMQAERSKRHAQLLKDKEEAEALKSEREAIKSQAEERENVVLEKYREAEELEKQKKLEQKEIEEREEALKIFDTLDTDKNTRISVTEVMANKAFDQNRDGEVTDDEARFFLGESEEVSEEEFLASCWKRMRPFYMMEAGLYSPPEPTEEQPSQEETLTDPEPDVEETATDLEGEDEDDREEDREPEEEFHADDGRQPDNVQYDEETQHLVDVATKARQDFEEADRAVRDVQREVRQLEEALEKDYGPDHEYSPLDGECFEYSDREYVYKLCPFDQATQRAKVGGSETRLGTWGQWAGPEQDKYSRMMYDKGQGCWNGPQRSTFVVISCGIENELIAVSEPNRCEYKFEFVTPAACRAADSISEGQGHDEL